MQRHSPFILPQRWIISLSKGKNTLDLCNHFVSEKTESSRFSSTSTTSSFRNVWIPPFFFSVCCILVCAWPDFIDIKYITSMTTLCSSLLTGNARHFFLCKSHDAYFCLAQFHLKRGITKPPRVLNIGVKTMVINQSENEESGLILQSFSIVLLKIIPVVFSSRGKRGGVSYYSLQYSDETNLSLGSRKWGNCLRQRLPEGPECPWPHSVLSHGTGEDPGTVCIPPSHLAPGICRANCCFLLWQAAAITSRAAGLVWTRIIQEISPDSTKVSTVLSSAVPLGFLLNFFVLPQGANTECCCISQLSNCLPLGRELSYHSLLSRPWEKLPH